METETNIVSFLYKKQLYDPSFVSKLCYNFFFQNYPLNQYYGDHQFWGVSKARGRCRGWIVVYLFF